MAWGRVGRCAALLSLLAGTILAAGCTSPTSPVAPTYVDPPEHEGGHAPCSSEAAIPQAIPFRADATNDSGGRDRGIHRLDADRFLWVWARYEETQRDDRITRVNEVHVDREHNDTLAICTRVELSAPIEVDGVAQTYDIAVLLTAVEGLPDRDLHIVVNWVAACPCQPLPSGATIGDFAPWNESAKPDGGLARPWAG